MDSFYGGRNGIDFFIAKSYQTLTEFKTDAEAGLPTIMPGQYFSITLDFKNEVAFSYQWKIVDTNILTVAGVTEGIGIQYVLNEDKTHYVSGSIYRKESNTMITYVGNYRGGVTPAAALDLQHLMIVNKDYYSETGVPDIANHTTYLNTLENLTSSEIIVGVGQEYQPKALYHYGPAGDWTTGAVSTQSVWSYIGSIGEPQGYNIIDNMSNTEYTPETDTTSSIDSTYIEIGGLWYVKMG